MTALLDRYVAAAADDFPGRDNSAIAREVRAAVEDMVEAKMEQGLSRADAERAAIEELGEPQRFAEQFRQEPRYLIGPKVFRTWWMALKIALAVLIPLFAALGALDFAAQDEGDVFDFISMVVGGAFEAILQSVFWVTLTFAIIELTGSTKYLEDEYEKWTADDLPEINADRQIGVAEVVISLVALVGGIYLMLKISANQGDAFGLNRLYNLDPNTPVFNPDLSAWWGITFIGLLAMSLIVSIIGFVSKYWAQKILVLNLIENGIWLAFIALLASTGDIINPAIREQGKPLNDWDILGENANTIILGVMLIIVLWDIFEAVKGHLEYRRLIATSTSA